MSAVAVKPTAEEQITDKAGMEAHAALYAYLALAAQEQQDPDALRRIIVAIELLRSAIHTITGKELV